MRALALTLWLCAASAFATTAELSWTAPTKNTDGTDLTDLVEYRLYRRCGAEPTASYRATIAAPSTHYVDDMPPDGSRCWWQLTAVSSSGGESARTNEVSKGQLPGDVLASYTWQLAQQPPPPIEMQPLGNLSVQNISSAGGSGIGTTLTVPSGGATVVVMYSAWDSTMSGWTVSGTPTLNGNAPDYSAHIAPTSVLSAVGVAVWDNVAGGSQTLSFNFAAAADEGISAWAYFAQGATTFGGTLKEHAGRAGISTGITSTLTSLSAFDLVLRFEQQYNEAPAAESGWKDLGVTSATNSEYARASRLYVGDAGDIVATGQTTPNYTTIDIVALEPATAANATDDFQRTDSSTLGANWTQDTGLQITSNDAAQLNASTVRSAYWSARTWANNQFAEVILGTIDGSADDGVGPLVRWTGTTTYYFAQANGSDIRLYKRVSGSYTQLGSTYTATAAEAGDLVSLEVNGTALTVYLNGVSIITATDSAITSGSAGIWMAHGTGTIRAWRAGDIGASGITASLSKTLGAVTAASSGTIATTGSLASTLAALGLTADGSIDLGAALAKSLDAITLSATAGTATERTAAVDVTLASITVDGAGQIATDAQLSSAPGAVTLASSGQVEALAALAEQLGALTLSATAALGDVVTADLASTLGSVSISSSGTVTITGALARTFGGLTLSSSGAAAIDSQLSNALGALGLSSAAGITITGTLARSLGPIGLASSVLIDAGVPSLSDTLRRGTVAPGRVRAIVAPQRMRVFIRGPSQ